MTDWDSYRDAGAGTWGDLVRHAKEFGVTIETLPGVTYEDGSERDVQYLARNFAGGMLGYIMPLDCSPSRKLGFGRMAAICSRLKMREPDGWPVEF